jgi:acyl-CoA dehydrogenase
MEQDTNLVTAAAERIFAQLADPQTIILSGSDEWKIPLWRALEETGLPAAWAPEDLGGHGLSLAEGFTVVRAAGRAAIAVPLVETMMASWILGRAGLAMPTGAIGLIPVEPRDRVSIDDGGRIRARSGTVRFAQEVSQFVAVGTWDGRARVAIVPASECRVTPGIGLSGDSSDRVEIDTVATSWADAPSLAPEAVYLLGATARALQMAGALEAILEMSVRYAQERVAFEKPIARFQAIQHNLARLAGEVAAAVAVAESAADAFASFDAENGAAPGDNGLLLEIASAKVRCGEAAETGAAIAHQVHGAIGFTDEHVLHRYTLRALSWRDEFGDESYWSERLGRLVTQGSADALWALLATR